MIFFFLLSCSTMERPEPDAAALSPLLTMMDVDGDGRVSADDYAVLAPDGPAFSSIDQDDDGTVSVEELAANLREASPTIQNTGPGLGPGAKPKTRDPATSPLSVNTPANHRLLRDAFNLLDAEARHRSPGGSFPTNEEIRDAVLTSDIKSETSQVLLRRYAALWEAGGVAFPEGLLIE